MVRVFGCFADLWANLRRENQQSRPPIAIAQRSYQRRSTIYQIVEALGIRSHCVRFPRRGSSIAIRMGLATHEEEFDSKTAAEEPSKIDPRRARKATSRDYARFFSPILAHGSSHARFPTSLDRMLVMPVVC